MIAPLLNYQGPDWSLLEQALEMELMDTYKALANTGTTPAETDRLRGRAEFISILLDLKNQQPQPTLTL